MATSSALPQDRDELDRLVEELAQREALSPNTAQHEHALPEYVPLSHGDPFLSAEYFDVEGFLVARAHLSIADLRTELRQYHAQLKEELVKLINDDYEDFISLSTDLRDEGLRMERIKHPLADLKDKILVWSDLGFAVFSQLLIFTAAIERRAFGHTECHSCQTCEAESTSRGKGSLTH